MLKKTATILIGMMLSITSVYAAEEQAHEGHGETHATEHEAHANHVAVFAGATTVTEHETHHYFTLGADYERFFMDGLLGAGALVDAAFTDADTVVVLGVPFFVHPVSSLKLFVAPGLEMVAGHNEFMVRGGLGYDIHVGNYSVTPTASIDYIVNLDHTAYVYGIAVGRGF